MQHVLAPRRVRVGRGSTPAPTEQKYGSATSTVLPPGGPRLRPAPVGTIIRQRAWQAPRGDDHRSGHVRRAGEVPGVPRCNGADAGADRRAALRRHHARRRARGCGACVDAGIAEGSFAKILINVPGFSLAYAWHKSDYPLPLHSHDVDCCYLIIAGDLRVGDEALGKGDGFFVPAGTPYTFTTGPKGVEFIEYRHANSWNIVFKYRNETSWKKAATTARDHHEAWRTEAQPFGLVEPVAAS